MKIRINYFLFTLLFLISILSIGCASTNRHYRDATGVLKTDTRSAPGVNK
jgi:hypothetical protein